MSNNFSWGTDTQTGETPALMTQTIEEVWEESVYEKYFEVEEGDIVLDIGATTGDFSYIIQSKKPHHCFVVEPTTHHFKTLQQNLMGYPVSFIKAAITDKKHLVVDWDGQTNARTLTFSELIEQNALDHVDFLKIDCEGGEYDVFKKEHIEYLKSIPKIAGEFHLWAGAFEITEGELILKFSQFAKNILPHFTKYIVTSVDGVEITNRIYDKEFLDYYHQVMIYIDNR